MPDPNQTNSNQNLTNPPLMGDSSSDQSIGFPQPNPAIPVAPLPVAPQPSTPDVPPSQPAVAPSILPQTDLPPLVPDFQNVSEPPIQNTPPNPIATQPTTGNDQSEPTVPPGLPPIISNSPKKKFGGGKIIATILGLLLLVGGIGGGVLLTQQNQNLSEKASTDYHIACDQCLAHAQGGYQCTSECTDPNLIPGACNTDNGCGNGQICQGGQCVTGNRNTCTAGQDCGPASTIGASPCNPSGTQLTNYCCPAGQIIQGGACTTLGGGGSCGGATAGQACTTGEDCHCQGGDACTSKICEPDIHTSCTNQGRSWCDNMQSGTGKTCCVKGYVCRTGGEGCVPGPTNPPGGTPPPSGAPTAQCQNVKAYSSTFTALTSAQLAALAPNTVVNFCVTGSTTAGIFDKAKFTINSVAQSETTTKRPASQDFCQSYTIPATTKTFNISAQIHHATLGWK